MLSIKTVSLEESRMQKHAGNPVLIGIIMSISNPYWSIWWLTIGMGLVLAAQKSGLIGIMVFSSATYSQTLAGIVLFHFP